MPDVELTNPVIQIDLSGGESTTVPSGERWKVSLMTRPDQGEVKLNGTFITKQNNTNTTAHIRTDLFANDTVTAGGDKIRIRGYRVDS
jgi:hypothetical protein